MGKQLFVVMCVVIAGFARVMPPPGGVPDKELPRVIETTPGQNGVAADLGTGAVRIVFD